MDAGGSMGFPEGYEETIVAQLDPVLTYIISEILNLPQTSLIYNQDEIVEVLDLITMSRSEIESITGVVGGVEKTISKRDARLLTQFTWWHNDLASKMVNNEFPESLVQPYKVRIH